MYYTSWGIDSAYYMDMGTLGPTAVRFRSPEYGIPGAYPSSGHIKPVIRAIEVSPV